MSLTNNRMHLLGPSATMRRPNRSTRPNLNPSRPAPSRIL